MDFENYFEAPQETEETNKLINRFHYFMIFANMKKETDVEIFLEFAKEFEKEIEKEEKNRSIEFTEKVSEIERVLQKFEDDHIIDVKIHFPNMKNTFSTYCSKFELTLDEPYDNDREFEDAMFELRFGSNVIPEL